MIEKLFFRKLEAWVLIAALLVGIIFTIMFGGVVMYKSKGGVGGGPIGDV